MFILYISGLAIYFWNDKNLVIHKINFENVCNSFLLFIEVLCVTS